jgi:hypothetical protein
MKAGACTWTQMLGTGRSLSVGGSWKTDVIEESFGLWRTNGAPA